MLVGMSGAGKSTTGERMARSLGQPFVELDELFWAPNWQEKPTEVFVALVREAAAGERWVIAGNYRAARYELWPRATTVIWLNFGFSVVLRRVIARTYRRLVQRQVLWHGNRESWRRTFSRKSIVWWVITNYSRRKREFTELRASGQYPHLHWYEFTRPAEVERFLAAGG